MGMYFAKKFQKVIITAAHTHGVVAIFDLIYILIILSTYNYILDEIIVVYLLCRSKLVYSLVLSIV